MSLQITNTGKAAIAEVDLRINATLVTGISVEPSPSSVKVDLQPGHQTYVSVAMPLPSKAGTYAGTIALTADGAKTFHVGLALSTRGPTNGKRSSLWWPFVLFNLTLLLGLIVSTLLDAWFAGGGLKRVDLTLALVELSAGFRNRGETIRKTFSMPTLEAALQVRNAEVDALLGGSLKGGNEEAAAQRLTFNFEAVGWLVGVLTAMRVSTGHAALATIDAFGLPNDSGELAAYLAKVRAELTRPQVLAAFSGHNGSAPAELKQEPDPAVRLRRLKRRMANLEQAVIWFGVASGAYLTLYVPSPGFGSSVDYLKVLTWALGVTQTGSQLLTRARR